MTPVKKTVSGAPAPGVRKTGLGRALGVVTKKNLLILLVIVATGAIVQALRMAGIINDVYDTLLATICINVILAVSLNLVTGFTGQFSLGHAGFMSIGAYTCGLILVAHESTLGFIIGIVAAGIVAAIFGALIGFPTLRLKGDYLAIATLGFGIIVQGLFLVFNFTGGAAGLVGIPIVATWPWLFGITVLTIILINNFIKSSRGRACIAIREDEIAAEAMGINSTKYKVMSFAIGAFFAGIAGGLYASYFYIIKPTNFGFVMSINILVIVVLGGLGSLTGSVIAAILVSVLTTFLQNFAGVNNIIYALLLIIIMLFRPQGLMGTVEVTDLLKRIGRKKKQVE